MRTYILTIAASIVALTSVWALTVGAAPQDEEVLRKFMRAKLVHCESALEGLVMADLDSVTSAAAELTGLMDDPKWNSIRTPEYVQLSSEFRRTVARMSAHAGSGNLDGASLAFVQMTTNCFDCHRFARERD